MDLGVTGQGFIVTGGSSGIGLATASALIDEGAFVTICGRDIDRLNQARDELASDQLNTVVTDVLVPDQAAALIEDAIAHAGRLDGIAAVAGRGRHGSLLDLPAAEVEAELAEKVHAVLNVVRPSVSALEATRGRIVILTAPTARSACPAMGAVSAARSALDSMVDSLAAELAPRGVRVNGVGVGLIDTPRQRSRYAGSGATIDYGTWLQAEAAARSVPLARPGTPDEVATAIALLLSPKLSYTTGAVIDVTGGLRSR